MSNREAIEYLTARDPLLGEEISRLGPLDPLPAQDYFYSLVQKVLSQLLSVKAAATIRHRLLERVEGDLSPEKFLAVPEADYRACGVSGAKTKAILGISRKFVEDPGFFEGIHELGDEEIIRKLVTLRGIGQWTAEMFLIFTLNRPNVFSPGDVGLRNAMMRIYGWEEIPDKRRLIEKAKDWSPFKSVACRYLWKSLHVTPS